MKTFALITVYNKCVTYNCKHKRHLCVKVSDEYNELQFPVSKNELPLCAASWDDAYGNYTCDLLGRG